MATHSVEVPARTVLRVLALTFGFSAILYLAYMARHELIWIATAFFLAVALNPAVEYFATRMPGRSRALAAGTIFLLAFALIASLVAIFTPPLISQTDSLVRNLPHYITDIEHDRGFLGNLNQHYHFVDWLRQNERQLDTQITHASSSLVGIIRSLFSSLIALFSVLALTFFMLVEGPRWIESFWSNQASEKQKHRRALVHQMYRAVTGYVSGNLLTSLIASAVAILALFALGVPFAIPLGVIVGLFDLIPLVGATLAAVLIVTVALFHSVFAAVVMAVLFLIYQQFENHILQPLVYSKTVQISPLLVLIAILLGAALSGLLGALVAIPAAASIQILVRDYFERHPAQ